MRVRRGAVVGITVRGGIMESANRWTAQQSIAIVMAILITTL